MPRISADNFKKKKVKVVSDNLKIERDRQKSYADNRRRDLQFKIGDQVFLKIAP